MVAALATGLRSVFVLLGCVITATVIYTCVTDGLPFREDLLTPCWCGTIFLKMPMFSCLTPFLERYIWSFGIFFKSHSMWMAATLIDFYINIFAIGLWVIYKESSWILSMIWIVLLICFGSITTCGYIVLQLIKLSPQESIQDPIYFVLLSKKKDERNSKGILSVVIAKVLFATLGCLMLGTLIYTICTDGSPFRRDVLTPWLSATLVDFYINIVALSVWVAYKEGSWKTTAIWIILLICSGSIATCGYVVLQLFRLSPQDPVFLILFSSKNRAENLHERILQA